MKRIIIGLGFLFQVIISCHQLDTAPKEQALKLSATVAVDSAASSCPHFAKDSKGNPVLSWVRTLNDSTSIVCFSVSADNGQSFGKAIKIPPSTNVNPHAENMPKLIFKPSGEIIAAWGASNPNPKNPYAGLVFFAQSFDNGATWTEAKPLVKDPASFDQRYFDLALLPNGEAGVIWLDNRKKQGKEGSAIYFAATGGNAGFQQETLISESCCECCRTNLFIDSKNNIHVAYRGIINDSIRDMVHAVSLDNGKSFSSVTRLSNDNWVISGCPHTGPAMVENKSGLHFAWYTMGGGSGLYFCSSQDNGKSFSSRDSIRNKAAARHPQLIAFSDGAMAITWDETMQLNNVPSTRIGIQKRSPDGEKVFTQYITSDTSRSTYPVIQAVGKHGSVIAFNEGSGDKSRVVYQRVDFND